jgi:LuxR family maltose regulon positive regulatory protein
METPLLQTKLYIPPTRLELVPRPRLLERLNEGLRHKLTLVSAPAGFGKTTLVSEWLGQSNLPVAWLSLDEGDNDLARFFVYLIAALETVQTEIGVDVQMLLQSPQPPPLETTMTMLINHLAAVPVQFVVVLDDYHLIEQESIHQALTFLLDHLPSQMHLVIASRADPPLHLALLRTRNQLVELRAQELRFTLDETVMFLNQAMGLELLADDIAALEARTEGWIAGLQLAALSIRSKVTEQATDFIAAFSGSHRHVIDFLAEEVVAQQPGEIRDFLYHTAILDRLTASLCNAVTGRQHSEAILAQLEQANLFLIPLDDQRQWYRYHRLFADFLRSYLHQHMSDQIPELHRRASEWYEQQRLLVAAIGHALSGNDYERAAHLIEETADVILMRSEVTTLQGWIEMLPDKVMRTRPLLCIYHAMTLIFGGSSLESATSRLQDAIEADTAGPEFGGVVAFRAWVAAMQGDTLQTIELSQQALKLLPENSLFLRSLVSASVGLAYFFNGDLEPAFHAFSEVASIGQRTSNVMLTVIALHRLADIRVIQGQLNQAKAYYEQALELALDSQGRPRPIAGLALIGLGWLQLEWNDLEGAPQQLMEGIALTNKWSEVASLQGYIDLANAKQAQRDIKGANQAIETARQLALKLDVTEMDDILVGTYQARLWVAQGNLEAALRWVDERELSLGEVEGVDRFEQEAGHTSISFLRVLEYIPLARIYIAQREFDKALAVLKPLLPMVEKAGWMWFGLEIMTLQAIAYQHQGDTTQALAVLERALTLAEPDGFVRIFIDNGPPLGELLQQAAARGIAVDYVGKLLAAFFAGEEQGPPESSATPASTLAEPLSERELEVLQLIAAGLSNREIAEQLVVAISTVKTHLNNIYGKLNVSSRTQAIARARALKLI